MGAGGGGAPTRAAGERAPLVAVPRDLPERPATVPSAVFYPRHIRTETGFNADHVSPTLVLGSLPRGHGDIAALRADGVTEAVSLNERHELALQEADFARHGIRLTVLPTVDMQAPSPESVEGALAAFDRAAASGGRAFVHCLAGRGRSATVAACHMNRVYGMSPSSAVSHLQSHRPIAWLAPVQEAGLAAFAARR